MSPRDEIGNDILKMPKQYRDEDFAYKYLESLRWKDGVICPHCQHSGARFLPAENGKRLTRTGKITQRRIWRCEACGKQFSVLVGTIFEDSRVPLNKWLLAVHELTKSVEGVSSLELSRRIGVTQKSAWAMINRLRRAVALTHFAGSLEDHLEGARESEIEPLPVFQQNGSVYTDSMRVFSAGGWKENVQGSEREAGGYFSQIGRSVDETFAQIAGNPQYRYFADSEGRNKVLNRRATEQVRKAIRKVTPK